MTMAWLRLKNAVVALFAALLGLGALLAASKGLLSGRVFCLVCRRGAPEVPFPKSPALFLLNEALLVGLGALCVVAAWFTVQRLRVADTPEALEPPLPVRAPARPGTVRAVAAGWGRRLLQALGWASLLLAAWLGWASASESLDGFGRLLPFVAAGAAAWGGCLLVVAGPGWPRRVGQGVLAALAVAFVVLQLRAQRG